MNTATINRDYLGKIFATMSRADTAWAIKTLTENLLLSGEASDNNNTIKSNASFNRPLPKAVLSMTMKRRKRVSYETTEDYRDDLTNLLEEKYK